MSTITLNPQVPQSFFSNVHPDFGPDFGKDFLQVLVDSLKTKDLPKLINYLTQLFGRFQEIPSNVRNMGVFAGDVKNFMSGAESFTKLNEARQAIIDLMDVISRSPSYWTPEIGAAVRTVIRKLVADFSNCLCDGIKLSTKFFPFAYMRELDLVIAVSTSLGASNNFVDDIIKVVNRVWTNTMRDYQMIVLDVCNIGTDVCLMVVGGMGLYTFATGIMVSEMLYCLIAVLAFSITRNVFIGYTDPEGKNFSPAAVAARLRQERITTQNLQIQNTHVLQQSAALQQQIAGLRAGA